jgi:hypothetical protein
LQYPNSELIHRFNISGFAVVTVSGGSLREEAGTGILHTSPSQARHENLGQK